MHYDDLDAASAMLTLYHARQVMALAEMMGEERKGSSSS
jgi:hypothetical protein